MPEVVGGGLIREENKSSSGNVVSRRRRKTMTGKHANIKKLEDLATDVKFRAQHYGKQAKGKVLSAVSKGRDILRKKSSPS